MKKILDKVKTKVLEGINLLALKLTARSANLACDWLYFQDEEPEEDEKVLMRKRIIDWIFTLQSQRGILGEKERRLYTYAYGLLLNKIAIYAIIAIVGTITGNWIGMFSFLLPFTILRQYAGGIHLEKPMNCIIFSGFLVFGCGQYLAVASDIGKILCALWVAAILLIFVLAPIDTKGKKLDKTAKKIYGRRARGVLVIEVMIAICFWVCGFIVVTKGIAIAHIILMVSLITGKANFFDYR